MTFETFVSTVLILMAASIIAVTACLFCLLRMVHAVEIRLNRLEAAWRPGPKHHHEPRR